MGFLGRIDIPVQLHERREMGARDFIWLAALGTAAREPATLDDICQSIDTITRGQWLPVGELIAASVEEMVRGAHLQRAGSGQDRVRLTPHGRQTLSLLLAQPIARPASVFGQVGLRMKLAFLDLAEEGERRLHFSTLIRLHEEELARSRAAADQVSSCGPYAGMWHDQDTDRLRRDIAVLRRMAETSLESRATRH